jgi:spermidine synthase
MEWFIERHENVGLMIRITEKLFDFKGLQHIQIYETAEFGKMLVLDGAVQLTEKDEAFYHEMLVHVPMLNHKNPKRVLVIGGGDGGCVREVLKHEPEEVMMVEIDRDVIEACKKYIGIDKGCLEDSRVSVINEDGIEFVKSAKEKFDVLIVDGTDPTPVSKSLIKKSFYKACSKITDIFNTQSQSPFIQQKLFKDIFNNIVGFKQKRVYVSFVPTYPLGLWSYSIAANEEIVLDLETIKRRFEERDIRTTYYTPELHVSSFTLPKWLEEIVKESIG